MHCPNCSDAIGEECHCEEAIAERCPSFEPEEYAAQQYRTLKPSEVATTLDEITKVE